MFGSWIPAWLAGPSWPERAKAELQQLERNWIKCVTDCTWLLNEALRRGNVAGAIRYREMLQRLVDEARMLPDVRSQLVAVIEQISAPSRPAPAPQYDTYWVSSATLAEAYCFLTQRLPRTGHGQESEWMLAVTGLRNGHVRTLEHLIEVKLATQSAMQASFDMQDFTRIAVSLYEHGQALHAIFHSHRFKGPPGPSSEDERLQRILEEGGYPAIQAVFSEDGYVRFFARRRPFAVEVHGKGVNCIDREHFLYHIVHFGTLPRPTLVQQREGAAGAIRPLLSRGGR